MWTTCSLSILKPSSMRYLNKIITFLAADAPCLGLERKDVARPSRPDEADTEPPFFPGRDGQATSFRYAPEALFNNSPRVQWRSHKPWVPPPPQISEPQRGAIIIASLACSVCDKSHALDPSVKSYSFCITSSISSSQLKINKWFTNKMIFLILSKIFFFPVN